MQSLLLQTMAASTSSLISTTWNFLFCPKTLPQIPLLPQALSFTHSNAKPLVYRTRPGPNSGLTVNVQSLEFSGSFFEGGFQSEDDPNSPSGPGLTAVEDKEEPPCPPGLRQYETMAVLRPDMSEDERLTLTQKYEELLIAGGGMYVEVFNRGVIPLAYSIQKKNKAGESNTYLDVRKIVFRNRLASAYQELKWHRLQTPDDCQNKKALPCLMDLKGELKEKLQIILFDEELRKKDSQCCVCLGEFEMEEELLQVQSCKHVFHVDCIHHWLHNNTTCPLCRCSVIPISISSKLDNPAVVPISNTAPAESVVQLQQQHSIIVSHHSPGIVSLELHQHDQQLQRMVDDNGTTPVEESPSSSTDSGTSLRISGGLCYGANQDSRDSVTIHIQTHDS